MAICLLVGNCHHHQHHHQHDSSPRRRYQRFGHCRESRNDRPTRRLPTILVASLDHPRTRHGRDHAHMQRHSFLSLGFHLTCDDNSMVTLWYGTIPQRREAIDSSFFWGENRCRKRKADYILIHMYMDLSLFACQSAQLRFVLP